MNKSIFASILLCSALAAASAQAQHASHRQSTATPASFAALDKDHDRFVSRQELPKDHPLAPHFDMIDSNQDGKLSPAEYEDGLKMLQ